METFETVETVVDNGPEEAGEEYKQAIIPAQSPVSPFGIATQIFNNKGDLSGLKEMWEMQLQWEKNEAKKAFHAAVAKFKSIAPVILKDRNVQAGQAKYKHASLGNIIQTITLPLSQCGLSLSWNAAQPDKLIAVTTRLTHALGHSEEITLTAPPETTGSKNGIQAIGSTISYLERYGALALLGLATSDMDDDGAKAEPIISPEQYGNILEQINTSGIDKDQFCKYMKVVDIQEIKASDYQKAINAIEAKKAAKK